MIHIFSPLKNLKYAVQVFFGNTDTLIFYLITDLFIFKIAVDVKLYAGGARTVLDRIADDVTENLV
ncbi:hypothetical protein D3C87_1659970 [compost metagenome]